MGSSSPPKEAGSVSDAITVSWIAEQAWALEADPGAGGEDGEDDCRVCVGGEGGPREPQFPLWFPLAQRLSNGRSQTLPSYDINLVGRDQYFTKERIEKTSMHLKQLRIRLAS